MPPYRHRWSLKCHNQTAPHLIAVVNNQNLPAIRLPARMLVSNSAFSRFGLPGGVRLLEFGSPEHLERCSPGSEFRAALQGERGRDDACTKYPGPEL